MERRFTILLTDRNRHVRELLRRELAAEGYRVETARDGREVLGCLYHVSSIDLLVLDPDILYMAEAGLLKRLRRLRPELPVILHGFSLEELEALKLDQPFLFLEKSENMDRLKARIREVLHGIHPDGVDASPPQPLPRPSSS